MNQEYQSSSLSIPFLTEFKSSVDFDFIAKVIILGDSRSGKSSLFQQLAEGVFCETYNPTVNVDFRHRYITTGSGLATVKCKLSIWDCPPDMPNEAMDSIYKGANAIIITADVSDPTALEGIDNRLNEVRLFSPYLAEIYLVATKIDVENRAISSEMIAEKAGKSFLEFAEISSRTRQNIDALMMKIVTNTQISIDCNMSLMKNADFEISRRDSGSTYHLISTEDSQKVASSYIFCCDCLRSWWT